MHRPQFAYPAADGCRDEEFTYFFDGSNTPMLYTDISGKRIDDIPLMLERDAPFFWRGIKLAAVESAGGPNGTIGGVTGFAIPNVSVLFRDPYHNDLSDGLVPAVHYGFPSNPVAYGNALYTGVPFLLDPEIYCPPGGYILLFLEAPVLSSPTLLEVTLYGVKRFKGCV